MKNFIRIGAAAKQLNISRSGLRVYALAGKIDFELTPSGQRVFTQKAIDDFLGKTEELVYAFYCRDSGGSKENIESQRSKLETLYGSPKIVYKDAGSGLNENRSGLKRLLKDAKNGDFNTLAITAEDRLTRFGFTFIEELLKDRGVKIIIFDDKKEKSLQEELMQDFMSLIASFSGKFYKLRGLEQRKLLLEKAKEQLKP